MRIVVLCSDLGIRVPGTKGASLHLQGISQGFAAAGHQVLLVGVAGHGPPPTGVEHCLLPHPGRTSGLRRELRKIRFSAGLPRRVHDAIAAFSPEVIYERLSLFGTSGRELTRRFGCPHVVEVNAVLSREESEWRGLRLKRLAQRRERDVLDSAALVIAVSAEVAAIVRTIAPRAPTHVVPNGVDGDLLRHLPSRDAARRSLDIPRSGFAVGFAGALRPWHGVENAVDAVAMLPDSCRLVVAGDGPIRPALERRAADLGIASRVSWLGHVEHSRMPEFFAAIDVAVAPYPPSDNFSFSPLKVFEYLGAGVPTVASEIGQLGAILADDRGQLVPAGDPRALAAACERVRSDTTRWRLRSLAVREEVLTHHTWRNRAESIVSALTGVAPS